VETLEAADSRVRVARSVGPAMDARCAFHYRAAATSCSRCGRGMCPECAVRSPGGECRECTEREQSWAQQAELQRDARLALRRAGVSVPRRAGDPVFIRAGGHPLMAGLSVAVCIAIALGLGAATVAVEQRWGIPRSLVAPALGIVVGTSVTGVLGGTSGIAGVFAALLAGLAILAGPGTLSVVTAVHLPGPGDATAFIDVHPWVAWTGNALGLLLGFVAASGRRV
jgi:hypothetical protein